MTKNLHTRLLVIICVMLAVIPFFWLNPGEMDLGGDSSRLYFYDPYNYLKYNLLYAIIPGGFNIEQPIVLSAPLVGVFALLQTLLSPRLLITLFNSFNLVIAFLSMYGIVTELLSQEKKRYSTAIFFAAVFTGIYYIFSPIMVRSAWDKALITHAQIFLNPLLFYLLLRYIRSNNVLYLLFGLLVTFVFSVNFSWVAAPILFGFYPFAFIFLLLYSKFSALKINYKPLLLSGILLILLHAFHILPVVVQILNKSGAAFTRTFTSQNQFDVGLNYFLSIAPSIRLAENLAGLPQMVQSIIPYQVVFFLIPALLLIGLWQNTKKNWQKNTRLYFLFLFLLYLPLLFLITANITNFGLGFYKSLFAIPGFSMFRNFYGQWMFGYLFFLSLLLGYSFFYIFSILKKTLFQRLLFGCFLGLILISAFPFIRGDMINLTLNQGEKKEFKIPIIMDPEYEKVLKYIREDTSDSKYLTFPFTESFVQMLSGTQQGMYQGPSTISLLTGKSDFAGYGVMAPFNEIFLKLAREKKYDEIGQLLGLLSIRNIFYNSDNSIMAYWPNYPYQHVRDSLPKTQSSYKELIKDLPVTNKKDFGNKYHLYQLSNEFYLPTIYVAKEGEYFKKDLDAWGNLKTQFFTKNIKDPRVVYVENKKYAYEDRSIPTITFQKISPTHYKVKVNGATSPYILSLQHSFNPNWKIYLEEKQSEIKGRKESYFNGQIRQASMSNTFFDLSLFGRDKRLIVNDNHFMTNAYANGWYISPSDVGNKRDYVLSVEMTSQKMLYGAMLISVIALLILCCWFWYEVVKKRNA